MRRYPDVDPQQSFPDLEQQVLRRGEWERYVTRQARWVDFTNDYKTMDLSYMESVMWAFKRLWDKGLVYEGHRVMPYSWVLETPLSNFETRMDNAYQPRQDPAVTVALDLAPKAGDPGPLKLLIWATTRWTLPSDLALAVGADLDYAIVKKGDAHYVLGAGTLAKYAMELGDGEQVGSNRLRRRPSAVKPPPTPKPPPSPASVAAAASPCA